ncbi:hypothetical protein [Brucella rhizosphaerae]|uniref:Uncharacterized protein n=1 Tax=Brucella rhizosphaerae TaxID=571254 RepID=A0A256F039_9HYPH|nr:hypothetical protein [Brucella rhizosphaerae]OYR08090.1 hypothetical protein CEV32_2802 [Brucella rhizosphaerae]
MQNRIPRRHFGRELDATSELSRFSFDLGKLDDIELQKPELLDRIARQLIWSEGEKLISLIEETLSPSAAYPQKAFFSSAPGIPISRAIADQLAAALLSDQRPDDGRRHSLTPNYLGGGFAFDLLLYDHQLKRLRYIYLAYGLGLNRRAMNEWRIERGVLAGTLPPLAGQYFGVEVENIEFVMIDPMLGETKVPERIWSLNDLDQLTEIPGSAKQALEIQLRQRQMLGLWFGKSLAIDEQEQCRQIMSIITRLALDEMDRGKPPRFDTL